MMPESFVETALDLYILQHWIIYIQYIKNNDVTRWMKKNTCKPCWRQMLKKNKNWCPIQGNNFLPRKSHVVSCASLTRKSVQISGWGCRHARIDFMPQLFMPRSKIFQDIPTFRIMIHKCHKTLDCEVRMSVTSKFPEIFDVGMSSLRFFPGPEWPERWPCASWRDKMWEFGFGQFRNLDHWRSCWLNLNLWALVELGGTWWNSVDLVDWGFLMKWTMTTLARASNWDGGVHGVHGGRRWGVVSIVSVVSVHLRRCRQLSLQE